MLNTKTDYCKITITSHYSKTFNQKAYSFNIAERPRNEK